LSNGKQARVSKSEGDEGYCVARKGSRADLHVSLEWLFLGGQWLFLRLETVSRLLDGMENVDLVPFAGD
jgi:hypothetical protein